MADDLKLAAARGYSKGYHAGRRRAKVSANEQRRQRERQAFLDKAFLAALPIALNGDWSMHGKSQTTVAERTEVAWKFAVAALRQRKFA